MLSFCSNLYVLITGWRGEAETGVCSEGALHGEKPNHRSPGAILPKKCSPSKDRCWQWADYPDGEQLSYLYFWYKGTIFFCSKLQCKLNKVTSLTLECFWCIARGKRHLMSKYMQKVSTFYSNNEVFCLRCFYKTHFFTSCWVLKKLIQIEHFSKKATLLIKKSWSSLSICEG